MSSEILPADVVERINKVAEHFDLSERKCWSEKVEEILELTPIMICFIKECRDRRTYSNNEKDYFSCGLYKTFNMNIRTYKRWCAVYEHEELQAKARNNDLTNNEIDDFIQRKKREKSTRRGKTMYGESGLAGYCLLALPCLWWVVVVSDGGKKSSEMEALMEQAIKKVGELNLETEQKREGKPCHSCHASMPFMLFLHATPFMPHLHVSIYHQRSNCWRSGTPSWSGLTPSRRDWSASRPHA